MATRKQLFHPDQVRQKIQVSQLINRLTAHALSDTPIMDASQVNAARILIGKVIPDVATVTIGGDPDNPVRIEVGFTDEQRAAALMALLSRRKVPELIEIAPSPDHIEGNNGYG